MSQNTQLVPAAEQARALRSFLDAKTVISELTKVLPKSLTPERLIRQTLTLANKNPELLACSQISILAGMIQSAELGLELSGPLGQAYLVPRFNKKKGMKEATFQVGYRGLMALAYRSGKVTTFQPRTVHKGDIFSIAYGSYGSLRHEPLLEGERGPEIGYYAVVTMEPRGVDFEFMNLAEMRDFRKKYAATNPIWDSNWEDMAHKTVVRKLCKRLPVAVEAQHAAVLDEYHEQGHFSHLGDSPLPAGTSRTEALAERLDSLAEGAPEDSVVEAPQAQAG